MGVVKELMGYGREEVWGGGGVKEQKGYGGEEVWVCVLKS